MAVKAVPEGWHTITPQLFVTDAAKLVDLLKHAFWGKRKLRHDGPSKIHIGDSIAMVSEAGGARRCQHSSISISRTQIALIGALSKQGGPNRRAPRQVPLDRRAMVRDEFGNIWQIATHKEDLSLDEIRSRAALKSGGRRMSCRRKSNPFPMEHLL
jgi:PhnB protein